MIKSAPSEAPNSYLVRLEAEGLSLEGHLCEQCKGSKGRNAQMRKPAGGMEFARGLGCEKSLGWCKYTYVATLTESFYNSRVGKADSKTKSFIWLCPFTFIAINNG